MTREEAIRIIEVAKAEVEWEAPLDYQIAFDLAMEALKQPTQQWIPVSERLPETHLGWCLVTLICKDGERKTDMRWYSDYAGFEDFEDETIIAWMPMPEPYKEVE